MKYLIAGIVALGLAVISAQHEAKADPVSCNNLSGRICGWFVISPSSGSNGVNGVPNGNDANDCFQLGTTIDHHKPHCATLTHVCDLVAAQPDPGAGAYYIFVDDFGPTTPSNYVENAVCNASGYSVDRYFYIIGNGGGHFKGVSGVQKPVIEITGNNLHWGKFDVEANTSTSQDSVYIHGTAAAHGQNVQYFYNTTISGNSGLAIHVAYEDAFLLKQDTLLNNGAGVTPPGEVLIENSGNGTVGSGPVVYGNGISRSGSLTGIPVNPGYGVKFVNTPNGCYQENHTKNEKNTNGQYGIVPNLALVNSPGAYVLGNYGAPAYPADATFAYTADSASQVGLVAPANGTGGPTDQGPCAVQFQ